MAARGNFDQLIKQEQRRVTSPRAQDGGENARDRVARRLNVSSGKSSNPRTSTAYSSSGDSAGKSRANSASASSSVGRKGGAQKADTQKTKNGKPAIRNNDPKLPNNAPTPTPRGDPSSLPQLGVGGGDMIAMLLPLLLANMRGRGGGIKPYAPESVPPQSVPLSRVPNGPSDAPMLPPPNAAQDAASAFDPQLALPPHDPGALNESNVGRFFNEGELQGMREKMPSVNRAPGFGPRGPIPEFDPNIHVPLRGVRP